MNNLLRHRSRYIKVSMFKKWVLGSWNFFCDDNIVLLQIIRDVFCIKKGPQIYIVFLSKTKKT